MYDVATELQLEFHVKRACDGIGAIGIDFAEAHFAIYRHRVLHYGFDSIEAYSPIGDLTRFSDDPIRERASQAFSAKLRTQIETLHLTAVAVEFVERNASCELAFILSEQQASSRRRVVAGEVGEFLIEILKAQTEAERLCIFQEKFASLGDLPRGFRLVKKKTFYRRVRRDRRGMIWRCCGFCRHDVFSVFSGARSVLGGELRQVYPISMPPFTLSTCPVM